MRPLAIASVFVISACGQPPEGSTDSAAELLTGKIRGRSFDAISMTATRLPASTGFAVDLAEYNTDCGNWMASATDGASYVTLLFDEQARDLIGNHDVRILDGVKAVVTTWRQSLEDNSLVAESLALNMGSVTISRVDSGVFAGFVELHSSATGTALSGAFEADFCDDG